MRRLLAARGFHVVTLEWVGRTKNGAEAVAGLAVAKKSREQLETEEVLHRHRLAAQKYLDLVYQNKPMELILRFVFLNIFI